MPQHPYAAAYGSITNPFHPSPLSSSTSGYEFSQSTPTSDRKRPRFSDQQQMPSHSHLQPQHSGGRGDTGSDGQYGMSDDEDDDEDDEDLDEESMKNAIAGKPNRKIVKGPDGKPKIKLTRGSRACIACRKIKMRCIPDESTGPGGPCKRCKSGGHECIFEESNRGKRSTRKNEALTAKVAKMEAALRNIGAALSNVDPATLNSFSHALHSAGPEPEVMQLITSHASPSAGPTLSLPSPRGSFQYQPYSGESVMREGSASDPSHFVQPPLSPRLHSLPDNVLSPLGLLAEASLQNTDSKKYSSSSRNGAQHRPSPLSLGTPDSRGARNGGLKVATSDVRGDFGGDEDPENRGVASLDYFKPNKIAAAHAGPEDRLPELLTLLSREEISDLFEIYFDKMSRHVPLIYREFHTPELVLQRSQFLCTVVCALAARYYDKRPELHGRLSAYAKRLTFEVPSRGYKSVEVVQAYLLLSVWTLGPEKTFEQDRTWLMLGMAIRMATDLNLHRKSTVSGLDTDEGRARDLEIINRERCWLHCFVLDRSLSAQMGKPYTLREDYIIRNACEASWHQQRFSLPSDRALSAYVVLQQIMSRAIDSIYSSTSTVSGLRYDCDYMLIVRSAHEELRRWLTEWNKPDEFLGKDESAEYDSRAQFYFAYSSLVLYSFGLENALERAKMDISFFLTNVYEAATRVCMVVKEQFQPKHYLPYLPDTNFVMCSYALLSMLKLLKPELRPYHDSEEAIFKLVNDVADILEDCAVDSSHQPAIYAAFIREIVRKTREARRGPSLYASRVGSRVGSRAGSRVGSPVPGMPPNGAMVPPGTEGMGLPSVLPEHVFDPALMGEEGTWPTGDVLAAPEAQFTFIPSGGDMMVMPHGAHDPMHASTAAALDHAFAPVPAPNMAGGPGGQPSWAEYLPTFMGPDAFDGWDGSMLLPGFGRGQMTLAGGLLHSQFGSGIITPMGRSPAASRAQSRAVSRAQSPR